jgi:hypothetical protein
MLNEQKSNLREEAEKYGISVSCRIPAVMHKRLGEEAALRQISLASHIASLLQAGHQQGAESNAEINILLREKEGLQKVVATLKLELQEKEEQLSLKDKDEPFISPLRLNRDLLQKYQ